jgi:hypothetical protein
VAAIVLTVIVTGAVVAPVAVLAERYRVLARAARRADERYPPPSHRR